MRKSSKLNDYRRWFKGFTLPELKAIVAVEKLNIVGVGPAGYQVYMQESNGRIISKETLTKEQLLAKVAA